VEDHCRAARIRRHAGDVRRSPNDTGANKHVARAPKQLVCRGRVDPGDPLANFWSVLLLRTAFQRAGHYLFQHRFEPNQTGPIDSTRQRHGHGRAGPFDRQHRGGSVAVRFRHGSEHAGYATPPPKALAS